MESNYLLNWGRLVWIQHEKGDKNLTQQNQKLLIDFGNKLNTSDPVHTEVPGGRTRIK